MQNQSQAGLWIAGQWSQATGDDITSVNPADGQLLWHGHSAQAADVDAAVTAARAAFPQWAARPLDDRIALCRQFAAAVKDNAEHLATTIAKEVGKPLWEARTEAAAIAGKIEISIRAQAERAGSRSSDVPGGQAVLRHRPHGVAAVFGPYNFPGHLPNGHIVPALLAGNTVVFKPSELTPLVAVEMIRIWEAVGLPPGVINLIVGARATGEALAQHAGIDALLFTGSARVGKLLHAQFSGQPGKLLALEMGGNNPLVVDDASPDDEDHLRATTLTIIQSAFLTAGQRCTCARRLYLPQSAFGDAVQERLVTAISKLRIDAWDSDPAPFMGPVIAEHVADGLLRGQDDLVAAGGEILAPLTRLDLSPAFLSPGLIEISTADGIPDEEHFGPLLQVARYDDFDDAIRRANNTRFGLSAGLVSQSRERWEQFLREIRAGIVNWNQQTTGASGGAPFGGPGDSGNLRPSAYYAADYCAYPVSSIELPAPNLPETLPFGVTL